MAKTRTRVGKLPDQLAPPIDADAVADLRALAAGERSGTHTLPLFSLRVLARLIVQFECWRKEYERARRAVEVEAAEREAAAFAALPAAARAAALASRSSCAAECGTLKSDIRVRM